MVGSVSTLYYVNRDNFLKSYANATALQDVEVVASKNKIRQDYQSKPVDFGGKTDGIQSKTRDIAALSFLLSDPKDMIRVRAFTNHLLFIEA
jgi:hypothetical protein